MTEPRSLQNAITLNATADAVWRALTEGDQIKRWFSLDARVEPGVGGSIWHEWMPGSGSSTPIVVWEPNQHLRTESDGFAISYFLEARGDTTVLRIVTSGFGEGSDWDEMYDGMDAGWSYFLFNLQIALERHPDVPRIVALDRRRLAATRAEGWIRLRDGLGLPAAPSVGDQLTLRLGGEMLTGRITLLKPQRCIGALLPGLNDAPLMFEQEPGAEKWKLGSYLSLYGLAAARAAQVQQEFAEMVTRLVGPPVES